MRLGSFRHEGRIGVGVVDGDHIVGRLGVAGISDLLSLAATGAPEGGDRLPLDGLELLPPVPDPPRIFCVGRNFKRAMARAKLEHPAHPILFARFAPSLVGHGAPIVRPKVSVQLDYEGELAVVIGRVGRHVDPADALGHVVGYTCFNDGSVRDWQRHTTQDTPGKNFWRSGSVGPWLVTADEVPDPHALRITTRLNGAIVQDETLDDLLFGVPDVIAYLSRISPLLPGDMIALGTPFGAGINQDPPRWLEPGDEVSVAIDGIGTLTNRVIDEGETGSHADTTARSASELEQERRIG